MDKSKDAQYYKAIVEELTKQGAGHYGIFSGSKFRQHIRPLISEFIHKYA